MLGKRSAQGCLFSPEQRLRHKIGEESFYAVRADHRHELFRDEDFAMLYCSDNGRSSVPPSLLAVALLLQTFDHASDQEATDRAKFDQRWQFALGIGDDEVPFAKSTLCLFRNQLIIHKNAKFIFHKGIEFLRTHGFMKKHGAHIVLDTTPIFGKGAVQDTFNMLAEGLRQVLKVLATLESTSIEQFALANDFRRYIAPSYKGSLAVESETNVITDVDVLPANVHDHQNATQLIDNSAATVQAPIEGIIGDGAYGNVEARVDAQTKGHTIVAPVSRPAHTGRFTKDDFTITLETSTVSCPAGHTTTTWSPAKVRTQRGTIFVNRAFRFSRAQCAGCALRAQCLKPSTPFRSISVHEQSRLAGCNRQKHFNERKNFVCRIASVLFSSTALRAWYVSVSALRVTLVRRKCSSS